MAFQEITRATATSIMLLTAELPPAVLPLCRVVLARVTEKHLPINVITGLKKCFTDHALQADPAYMALSTIVDISINREFDDGGLEECVTELQTLESEGVLNEALAALEWLRQVQLLAAADATPYPIM